MLEDRDYMRQRPGHDGRHWQWPQLSFTVWLIVLNAVLFILQQISYQVFPPVSPEAISSTDSLFALSLEGLRHGCVWQFLTFQFMHAGFFHLLFNCVAIFFFGRAVEMILGRHRFLALYLASGILGGVVQMLFAVGLPEYFDAPVVGASAGASGLVAAFAVLNWQDRFTLFLYFVPVVMRGRTLFWISAGLAVLGILTPHSSIANAAHLGGILTGFFYVRRLTQGRPPQWDPPVRHQPWHKPPARPPENKFWRAKPVAPVETLSAEEFLQTEVDPILDKISAHGIHSLTAREREILESARKKISRP